MTVWKWSLTAADNDDRNWTCEFRVAETLATA